MAEIIKPNYRDIEALLGLFDDFEPDELTADELAAKEKLLAIRRLQKEKHAVNVRRAARPMRQRIIGANK